MDLKNVTIKLTGDRAVLECDATPEVKALVEPGFSMWTPKHGDLYYRFNINKYFHVEIVEEWCNVIGWEGPLVFPTRELAETQAEIDSITRKLNQAAVKYGGMIGARHGAFAASTVYEGALHWSTCAFVRESVNDKFGEDFHADLTRLAELNASLTKQWQVVFNQ